MAGVHKDFWQCRFCTSSLQGYYGCEAQSRVLRCAFLCVGRKLSSRFISEEKRFRCVIAGRHLAMEPTFLLDYPMVKVPQQIGPYPDPCPHNFMLTASLDNCCSSREMWPEAGGRFSLSFLETDSVIYHSLGKDLVVCVCSHTVVLEASAQHQLQPKPCVPLGCL